MFSKSHGRDFRVPLRLLREGWPRWLARGPLRRGFMYDPSLIAGRRATSSQFQRAMFGIHIGGTVKITWEGRQQRADRLLIENVDLDGADIVEMGASDGSTARDLITALDGRFRTYTITDRFIRLTCATHKGWTFLFREGQCILIAGRRVAIWPHLSDLAAQLTGPLISAAGQEPQHELLLLNPAVIDLIREDARVSWVEHNVFDVWQASGTRPNVIKVGNLLRHVYFTRDQIRDALVAIHTGLAEDGHLLLTDNSRTVESAGLFRRTSTGFAPVATTGQPPEIYDLVCSLALKRA